MSIGTPKRLRNLEAAQVQYISNSMTDEMRGKLKGYRDCWEAVKPVLEAAQKKLDEQGTSIGEEWWELADALAGLALEE